MVTIIVKMEFGKLPEKLELGNFLKKKTIGDNETKMSKMKISLLVLPNKHFSVIKSIVT